MESTEYSVLNVEKKQWVLSAHKKINAVIAAIPNRAVNSKTQTKITVISFLGNDIELTMP